MVVLLSTPAILWLRVAVKYSRITHTTERYAETFTPQTKEPYMTMVTRILTDPAEIKQARREARDEYERNIIDYYGYMIFTKEHLDRQYPIDNE